eukprot:scaffold21085_cov19-Tisochrysis_lutea.AAC.1
MGMRIKGKAVRAMAAVGMERRRKLRRVQERGRTRRRLRWHSTCTSCHRWVQHKIYIAYVGVHMWEELEGDGEQ